MTLNGSSGCASTRILPSGRSPGTLVIASELLALGSTAREVRNTIGGSERRALVVQENGWTPALADDVFKTNITANICGLKDSLVV